MIESEAGSTEADGHGDRRRSLFAAACAGIFVFGSVLALLGTLFGLPAMRRRLALDPAGQGNLLFAEFLGIFISTSVVGPLLDRLGKKAILSASSALVAVALLGFAWVRNAAMAGVCSVALGLGAGGLNTAVNVLVADLYDVERASRLNILGVCFGVGALVVPLTAASLSASVGIEPLLFTSAAMAGACLAAFLALPFPPAREGRRFSLMRAARVARSPGVGLFAGILFCQSGNEASVAGWTSTYVAERGWTPAIATWVLSAYWAGLLVGRLVSARSLAGASKTHVVLGSGIGSAAGAAILLGASTLWQIALGVALLGVSFANVYPTSLAMVADRYRAFTGTLFGALFSIGLVGGMLFPWAIGQIAEVANVRRGMVVPLLGALTISFLVVALQRRHPA